MFKDETQSKNEWNTPLPSFLSNQSSLTNSTCFTSPTLWESSLPPTNHFLNEYRKHKPNKNIQFNVEGDNLLPKFLCKIFSFEEESNHRKTIIPYQCKCDRGDEDSCSLIIKWIEDHYYWKTDQQFRKIYHHYKRKKTSQCLQQISVKLENITSILGLKISQEQIEILSQIIANFIKHTVYYSKADKFIKQSETYLWVALGIVYHIGINSIGQSQQIIFWALDITMNSFEDLSLSSVSFHTEKVMQYLGYYFPKWINFLVNEKKINMKEIVREWISEMMFGYMGIQSIAFFIDCFMKMKWRYLYKVILSYFEKCTDELGKNELFLTGSAKKQDILKILINSKEEWPMIFCGTVTFNFENVVQF